MLYQLLLQEIQPSEHTAGGKLILPLHTAITSKGCFQIPQMKFQPNCSIFKSFVLMKHWKLLLAILVYIVLKHHVSININKEITIATFIGIQIIRGIIQLPNYWDLGLKIQEYLRLLISWLLIALKNWGSIFILLIII